MVALAQRGVDRGVACARRYSQETHKFDDQGVHTVAYWTDVEGNLNYFHRLLTQSKVRASHRFAAWNHRFDEIDFH